MSPHRQAPLALVLATALGAGFLARPACAQDGRLELTTERVVVFKDGHCLIVKKAVGTSNADGEVFTEDVPEAAVLGSFWATADEGRLLSTTAAIVETENETVEERTCAHYLELLAANEGKQAAIDLDDNTKISGVIRKVLTSEQPQPLPHHQPWRGALGSRPSTLETLRTSSMLTGTLFTIATEEGDVVLGVNRVRKLVIEDMTLTLPRTIKERRKSKRLTFRFEGGEGERSLHVMYFRPGVRWIPTYRVNLAGEGADRRAGIRLQAEILNEAEDLVDVPFDVVVGVPNFRFKEVVSPFSLEQALRNALVQAAPQLMSQSLSNANFASRAGEWRGPPVPTGGGAIDLPNEIVAGATQDLFVYSLPRMTLRRGERAAVPVFETQAAYRDVYTWELALQRKDIESSPSAGASPLVISKNRVWHQIELVNETRLPWTTGAALVMDGHQPVAQELLTYTSPGGRVRVPLTVAIDVRGEFGEQETDRKLDALKWLRESYARIDKTGRLSITSSKRTPIDLEVSCHLGGHADAATHDGRITLGSFESSDWAGYVGHPAVNNHSVVRWVLELAPGETVTPEIEYHYFTRR